MEWKVFQKQISDSGQTTGSFATVVRKAGGMTALTGTGIVITNQDGEPMTSNGDAFVVVWDMTGSSGRELRAKVVQAK